jgi:hypothetical protein
MAMRHQPTVEFTCTCSHCGAANTVVEVGLPPGTEVACSHCTQKLGTIAELRDSVFNDPSQKPDKDTSVGR